MIFAYFVLCSVLYIIALPILLVLSFTKPKYKDSIPQRFFLKNIRINENIDIWIHACSLGEVASIAPLVKQLSHTLDDRNKSSQSKILLSVITNTGYTKAKELFGKNNHIIIKYLPFEIFLPFMMPKLKQLIVLEAELWYMLFYIAKKRGAKTILLNARISSHSFPKYKKIRFFYQKIFTYIDMVLCQQESDKERLKQLGAKNIEVCGNIKALNPPKITKNYPRFCDFCNNQQSNLDSNINTSLRKNPNHKSNKNPTLSNKNRYLILGASTHKGEEKLIVESFLKAFNHDRRFRLFLAPRHPERFDEVWQYLKQYESCKIARFSKVGVDYHYDILLIDALGELINLYNIASLVIMGGSFVKVGGHNPLECAFFGTKIISGLYIFNQYALFEMIEGYKIIQNDELVDTLIHIDSLPQSYIKNNNTTIESLLAKILNDSTQNLATKAING